ncbi:MAG: hypothetical protein ACTH58_17440 [Marinomonas foliarum]|uniref:hypothetical protein n=1 Tax=Marinomonas foliarum TaxID=491950 RepID=UPI003F989C71
MAKWLIWTLLEVSTLLLVATVFVLWMTHKLSKNNSNFVDSNPIENSRDVTPDVNSAEDPEVYKGLARYLDAQISFAANAINPSEMSEHEVNRLKIWGTILKAERAILLNQVSEQSSPILQRFLSSLFAALFNPKIKLNDIDELKRNVKDMEEEFIQITEVLLSKELLSENQFQLNEDLRNSIDRSKQALKHLAIKKAEKARIESKVNDFKLKIERLKQAQSANKEIDSVFDMQAPMVRNQDRERRTKLMKQIVSLSHLSDRQETVIDQLKNEMSRAQQNHTSHSRIEAQQTALAKLERIAKESELLILQLESELETSNLSIASLREYISDRDAKLRELEKQLNENNTTAIGSLQALNSNKKETIISLRDGVSSAKEILPIGSLVEQDKDTQELERLLHESETCVTLLAQELETIESENKKLKDELDSITPSIKTSSTLASELSVQRERNRKLVSITTELKEKVLEMRLGKSHHELRGIFNKKSLESDRLQLAFADLEKKYLGALKH